MALKDAIEVIVQDLQERLLNTGWHCDHCREDLPRFEEEVKGIIRSLQVALKASGDEPKPSLTMPTVDALGDLNRALQAHKINPFQEIATREIIKQARREESTPALARCEGGNADGDHVPLPPDMPQGAKTNLMGSVYVLKGSSLVYDEAETQKFLEARNGHSRKS